jgi:hypothetical protein
LGEVDVHAVVIVTEHDECLGQSAWHGVAALGEAAYGGIVEDQRVIAVAGEVEELDASHARSPDFANRA